MPRSKLSVINVPAILIVLIMGFSAGCDDTICSDLNTARVIISFFDLVSRAPKTAKFDTVTAIGTDSVFVKEDSATEFSFPVNQTSDSTVFLFKNAGITDTLTINYLRNTSLVSSRCGYSTQLSLLDITRSTFPEDTIVNKMLNASVNSNIQVYY